MNRRRFIRIAALGGIGVIITALIRLYDFDTVLFKILKKDLKALNIKDTVFRRYIEDAQTYHYWDKLFLDRKKKAFIIFYFFMPDLNLPHQIKYQKMKGELIGNFLLATDFFQHKMDEKRNINYLGLFDPYRRPCSNPFSHVYYPLSES